MEIVLPVTFTDVIFRRKRGSDRKYVCGSQAISYPPVSGQLISGKELMQNNDSGKGKRDINPNREREKLLLGGRYISFVTAVEEQKKLNS